MTIEVGTFFTDFPETDDDVLSESEKLFRLPLFREEKIFAIKYLFYKGPYNSTENDIEPFGFVAGYVEVDILGLFALVVKRVGCVVSRPLSFQREVGTLEDWLGSVECFDRVKHSLEPRFTNQETVFYR